MIDFKFFAMIFVYALIWPSSSSASLIGAGFSIDETNNSVTGNNLEWLQWDVTRGQSINSALATHSGDGWRLATNQEVSQLFNVASLGGVYDDDENTGQSFWEDWGISEDSTYNEFLDFFGGLFPNDPNVDPSDPLRRIAGYFGTDPDGDGLYNIATVRDDFLRLDDDQLYSAVSFISEDRITANYSNNTEAGIVLVRAVTTPIPTPPALPLFAIGLAYLVARGRAAISGTAA